MKDVKSKIDTNLNVKGQRMAVIPTQNTTNEDILAERSKMSGESSNKPSGTTKASNRYEDTNDSIHRTQSLHDQQSVDRNNPMDTESDAGATEQSSIQRQYDRQVSTNSNTLILNQRSPEGHLPSEYSQRSQAAGMREADAGAFGLAMASAGVNNAETA